ncbi:pyridoxamine 5'-phosphate oxidase [Gelidibacter algens]|uniref:Pyridoxamine 5'-phosphate oxidase n=1 Tax=Gelidibacter algens TaxID=49280 RepID=A0A1A7R505_9FLAO|nr:pyridoxal 5'-phosphate synthase [Gelidibacter algens]OBX25842.1 pyridoxamine 5'-phosphate oxidase [Gelidibacter algens]RAJ20595.1 pyridoxamine 5'-phosphate oxidase [Gelidibacter algens]
MEPIEIFKKWLDEELKLSKARISSAVSLSTIGMDSFPNARFVSYKELIYNCFIITGSLNSRKGIEMETNDKVALTFWWTETERQIRIQGIASRLSEELADHYFSERNLNSQAVSSICEQGKEIDNLEQLEKKVLEKVSEKTAITRPNNWGGFSIKPLRIEFMDFKKTRYHDRKLYEIENGEWNLKQLQS